MAIFDTSDIQTTGLTVYGVTTLSGNSSATILMVSGSSSANFSVTNTGARLHNFLYDNNNATGTTGQVLSTTSAGVDWIDGGPIMVLDSGTLSTIRCGVSNTATAAYSAALSGSGNTASGIYSSVGGGINNSVSGSGSTVMGGSCNFSGGLRSSISGGFKNAIQSVDSFIGGGQCNFICGATPTGSFANAIGGGVGNNTCRGTGTWSPVLCCFTVAPTIYCSDYCGNFIGGGFQNMIRGGCYTFIGGGCGNCAFASKGAIGGGECNSINNSWSSIGGGQCNTVSSYNGSIMGGACNCLTGGAGFMGGGSGNTVSGNYAVIFGGALNCNCGSSAMIGGGFCNRADGFVSVIGGGAYNKIITSCPGCSVTSIGAVILGGIGNNTTGGTWSINACNFTSPPISICTGQFSAIGGGFQNVSNAYYGFIGGGNCNFTYNSITGSSSFGAAVVGGSGNNTCGGTWGLTGFTSSPTPVNAGCFSFVGGGFQNVASGGFSGVLGGSGNTASNSFSGAFGCNLIACNACTFYVNNLCGCGSLYTSAIATGCAVCITTNGQMVGYTAAAGSSGSSGTSGVGGILPWTVVAGTSQTAAINNGYITNNAGLVTVTLPSTAAVGSVVEVAGLGAGGWKVAQNAGQTIHFGNANTTAGTGGSLASTLTYDAIRLLNIVANTDWSVLSVMGNITFV